MISDHDPTRTDAVKIAASRLGAGGMLWQCAQGLALLVAGCSTTPESHDAVLHRILGCYELQPGPWLTDSAHVEGLWTSAAPRRIELTATPLDASIGPTPEYSVRQLSGPEPRLLGAWTIVEPSRREAIIWRGGTPPVGLDIRASFSDDGFRGNVRVYTDAVIAGEAAIISRRVSGRRITCPTG